MIIQASEVSKQVQSGDQTLSILKNINLSIATGESLAIIGASGSGKSTLLGLLAGLDTPSSGRIILRDHDLSMLDEDGRALLRARYVGFVFQSFQLLPSLTAVENVMLPFELAESDSPREEALKLLERVGLEKRGHHYPRQLSGGEQQRVAIARAFAAQPTILFADEVTGNLDKQTGQTIIELLFELNIEKKTTLVLVTHDELLAHRCHRRIRLDGGKIVGEA
jgi:putative ABC transport system ATP-binding protein